MVLGTSGANAAPAFEKLLRGVSSACTDNGLRLTIGFVSADASHAPQWLANGEVDGLLLHGEQPTGLAPSRLRDLPAVWLMANRHRPSWGDQVMPNNAVIGDLAAKLPRPPRAPPAGAPGRRRGRVVAAAAGVRVRPGGG